MSRRTQLRLELEYVRLEPGGATPPSNASDSDADGAPPGSNGAGPARAAAGGAGGGGRRGETPVVFNYGHGGAGLTLAWGCAGDAVQLVRQALGS